MARKFAELEAKMSPEARARVAARVDAIDGRCPSASSEMPED